MGKAKSTEPLGGLELTEEVFQLLREAPSRALFFYYLGSLPFVLALLYYWADMAKSAFAYSHHAPGAVALVLLFVWMKTWQAAYARDLMAYARGQDPPALSLRTWARSAARQTMLQPWGLFTIPLALAAVVPFATVYARYQNLTALDDGGDGGVKELSARAAALARLWPRQNWVTIWALSPMLMIVAAAMFLLIMPVMKVMSPEWTYVLMIAYASVFMITLMPLSPFGTVVAVNVAMAILFLPSLLHSLLGVQSAFIQSPGAMVNSAFYAVVLSFTYLALDPAIKAAYVLRCFYGDSAGTGEDLKVELRASRALPALAAVVLAGLLLAAPARAQEPAADAPVEDVAAPSAAPAPAAPAVNPEHLDRAISSELQDRAYAWRLPRVKPEREEGLFSQFMGGIFDTLAEWWDALGQAIGRFFRWMRDLVPKPEYQPSEPLDFRGGLTYLMYALLAALLCVAGVFAYRLWARRADDAFEFAAEPVEPAPDLSDPGLTADALPESEWVALARDLMARGDTRLALRAWFLAGLARLAERELIAVARFKSNLDYGEEVARRAHVAPSLPAVFADNVAAFEEVWYGDHEADPAKLERVAANYERLAEHG